MVLFYRWLALGVAVGSNINAPAPLNIISLIVTDSMKAWGEMYQAEHYYPASRLASSLEFILNLRENEQRTCGMHFEHASQNFVLCCLTLKILYRKN
jgi:hypothetical protein